MALQNKAMLEHYASWLTDMTGVRVRRRYFAEDLADGTALCSIMARIPDSGVKTFKNVRESPPHLRPFHARDNMVKFQDACRRLMLPDSISTEELHAGDLTKALSMMVHLEELCEDEELEPLGAPNDGYDTADDSIATGDIAGAHDQDSEQHIQHTIEDNAHEEIRDDLAVLDEDAGKRISKRSSRRSSTSSSRLSSSSRRRSARPKSQRDDQDSIQVVVDQLKSLCGCDRTTTQE